ncbi:hypothetical protein NDN08_007053 [Rhodosorus marinus]|uniref:Uncharacterized protein n=1 Tax=Rhodosorus marinus TaxID=101924 RepID=A0AAV8UFE4_9RHOD|nr:hypothetical protein NDN08_007053 [Rhodosorus marinus]
MDTMSRIGWAIEKRNTVPRVLGFTLRGVCSAHVQEDKREEVLLRQVGRALQLEKKTRLKAQAIAAVARVGRSSVVIAAGPGKENYALSMAICAIAPSAAEVVLLHKLFVHLVVTLVEAAVEVDL